MSSTSRHAHPSIKALLAVFAALIILLVLTVWAAYLPLGKWASVAAMSIAGLKAALVAIIFMQLRYRPLLTTVFAMGGLLWLAILFLLTLSDYATRGG